MGNLFGTIIEGNISDISNSAISIYRTFRKEGMDKKTALVATRAVMMAQVSMVNELLEEISDLDPET